MFHSIATIAITAASLFPIPGAPTGVDEAPQLTATALAVSSAQAAGLTAFPSDGEVAAMCISTIPGRWSVWGQEPFGPVIDRKVFAGADGSSMCVFSGPATTYWFEFQPKDDALDYLYAKVVLTGSDNDEDGDGDEDDGDEDDDDDDTDVTPPPGKRQVVVLYRSEEKTPEFVLANRGLRRYCVSNGHDYMSLQNDAEDHNDEQAAVVRDGLKLINEEGLSLPAVIVSAEHNGEVYDFVERLPETEAEAVQLLKDLGG